MLVGHSYCYYLYYNHCTTDSNCKDLTQPRCAGYICETGYLLLLLSYLKSNCCYNIHHNY